MDDGEIASLLQQVVDGVAAVRDVLERSASGSSLQEVVEVTSTNHEGAVNERLRAGWLLLGTRVEEREADGLRQQSTWYSLGRLG